MKTYPLPIYVQRFFTERLATQLHASPNTVASLSRHFPPAAGRQPTTLHLADIDAT
jgi:integrase/recombinase XerD